MKYSNFFPYTLLVTLGAAAPHSQREQWPLKPNPDASQGGIYSFPLNQWNGLFHTINITLGTPPQPFNVSVDLTTNAFFVPSASCNQWACQGRRLYQSNASRTYSQGGRWDETEYWSVEYSGYLSRDTLRIGDLAIEDIVFEEYTDSAYTSILAWDVGFDGALGLGTPWDEDQDWQPYPNILSLLMQKRCLRQNVFALKFPRLLASAPGELTLGGSNPAIPAGPFRNVSLVPPENSPPRFRDGWNVPLGSITLNTSHPIHVPTQGYVASLVSQPLLILPDDLARNFSKIIGAEPIALLWEYIPCDRRPYLPELSFVIGGEMFTINAFDYTFEWDPQRGYAPLCLLWIGGAMDYNMDDGSVVLGTPFLKRWYTRWDLDERKIGCKSAERWV